MVKSVLLWFFLTVKLVDERFNMIPVSLFKCTRSHANVMCVFCISGCFVYNDITHALVLQWACVCVPTVTVVSTNVL